MPLRPLTRLVYPPIPAGGGGAPALTRAPDPKQHEDGGKGGQVPIHPPKPECLPLPLCSSPFPTFFFHPRPGHILTRLAGLVGLSRAARLGLPPCGLGSWNLAASIEISLALVLEEVVVLLLSLLLLLLLMLLLISFASLRWMPVSASSFF